jgi:hypothetical protein
MLADSHDATGPHAPNSRLRSLIGELTGSASNVAAPWLHALIGSRMPNRCMALPTPVCPRLGPPFVKVGKVIDQALAGFTELGVTPAWSISGRGGGYIRGTAGSPPSCSMNRVAPHNGSQRPGWMPEQTLISLGIGEGRSGSRCARDLVDVWRSARCAPAFPLAGQRKTRWQKRCRLFFRFVGSCALPSTCQMCGTPFFLVAVRLG